MAKVMKEAGMYLYYVVHTVYELYSIYRHGVMLCLCRYTVCMDVHNYSKNKISSLAMHSQLGVGNISIASINANIDIQV